MGGTVVVTVGAASFELADWAAAPRTATPEKKAAALIPTASIRPAGAAWRRLRRVALRAGAGESAVAGEPDGVEEPADGAATGSVTAAGLDGPDAARRAWS